MGEKFILEGQMAEKPFNGYSFVRTEWEFTKVIMTAKVNSSKLKHASKIDSFDEFEKWIEQEDLFAETAKETTEKGDLKLMFEDMSSFEIESEGKFSVILELGNAIYQSNAKGLKFKMFTTAMKRAIERHFAIAVSEELLERKEEEFRERKMLRIGYITKFETQDEK